MGKIDSVCIFIMTDYGSPNGKGLEAKSICESLTMLGISTLCFVRDAKQQRQARNVNFGGNLPYRAMTFIERHLIPSFKARYWQEIMFDYFSARKLAKIAKTHNPIVYLVPRMLRTSLVAKRLGLKIILHGVELPGGYNSKVLTKLYGNEKDFPNIWNIDLIKLSERTQKYADYVVAHTAFSMKAYIEYGIPSNKIYVTPMGFSDHHHLANKKNIIVPPLKFLFVGNITKAKGIAELLQAWNLIKENNCELHLCGAIQEDMKKLVVESKKVSNVFFHGYTNPAPFYSDCDVFVFPSLLESFGKVMVEAGANGLPVICNNTIAVGEFSGDNPCGKIFDTMDIKSIADAMLFYIKNPDCITTHGANAKTYYSNLTWKKFGDNTAKIIKKIISLEN